MAERNLPSPSESLHLIERICWGLETTVLVLEATRKEPLPLGDEP
jgi:hypothetical protein